MDARAGIPQVEFIATRTSKCLPMRTKRYASNLICITGEHSLVLARDGIPQTDGVVIPTSKRVSTPTAKRSAIRTKGYMLFTELVCPMRTCN